MANTTGPSRNESDAPFQPTRFEIHPTHAEQIEMGRALRDRCSRSGHAKWEPPSDRRDPIDLLKESSQGRIQSLIPVRYGRMLKSPFAWYRGSAMSMAADLATTPTTGLRVQACGDAHLCNFGVFATPERRVIFDVNDLDETLPAPWEWDVKRLAASFVLASRNNGFSEADARDSAVACVRSYREHMAELATMSVLEVWYASMDVENLIAAMPDPESQKRAQRRLRKATERSVLEHDFPELAISNGHAPVIRENPPLIYHWREESYDQHMQNVREAFAKYRDTLAEQFRGLVDRYQLMDIAVKVVGVGSVGTLCAVVLLMASENDPLFLQVKEARASVLEPYAGKSQHPNHGQRVVIGYKQMQAASDMFLGWTVGARGNHFYVRQLKDVKIKMLVEQYNPLTMLSYAEACGWCLARAHARSGEPAKISGYLGSSDRFDEAIGDFSVAYADQSERDHETLCRAVRAGELEVFVEDGI